MTLFSLLVSNAAINERIAQSVIISKIINIIGTTIMCNTKVEVTIGNQTLLEMLTTRECSVAGAAGQASAETNQPCDPEIKY